jgi:uncharacterized membrane protein
VQDWILSASYTLHMLATVLWIGGLVFQAVFMLPFLTRKSLDENARSGLTLIQTRFQPLAWLSLAILLGTGLTQMTVHPQYEGLLAVENRWSLAILAKHLSILPMVGINAFQSFVLHPRLQREMLRSKRSGSSPQTRSHLLREKQLVLANSVLSVIVLTLTAIARTS